MRNSFTLLALTALAGCATNFESKPLPADHPASVQAPEAPRSGPRRLLVTDELSRKSEMQLARKDVANPDFQSSGMSHDMTKMEGMDHSKMPGMDMHKQPASVPPQKPGMDHSKMREMPSPDASVTASPASKEAVEREMRKTSDEMKKVSDELKAKSDAAEANRKTGDQSASMTASPAAAVYTCPMHPEVNQPAPGKCPKCGMTLVKKEGSAK